MIVNLNLKICYIKMLNMKYLLKTIKKCYQIIKTKNKKKFFSSNNKNKNKMKKFKSKKKKKINTKELYIFI